MAVTYGSDVDPIGVLVAVSDFVIPSNRTAGLQQPKEAAAFRSLT